jgi:hypothetical protein
MSTLTFPALLQEEVAVLQAQHPDLADGLARAHALLTEGRLFVEDSGKEAMVFGSDGTSFYHVNGFCTCPASRYQQEPCKHRLSLRLYQKVTSRLVDVHRKAAPASTLPQEAFTTIQGKPFVRFEGLLALAHERGLVELTTTVLHVSADLAVCQAVARFRDGRTFTDIGDATPQNVPVAHLKPHFIRLAATRASARALRRALNISACWLPGRIREIFGGSVIL